MKIRNHLDSDETISELDFEQLFLSECVGIALTRRAPNDKHICMVLLSEDDGHWFVSSCIGSSYWMDDLIELLQYVKKWMEANAKPQIVEGWPGPCGYVFKDNP